MPSRGIKKLHGMSSSFIDTPAIKGSPSTIFWSTSLLTLITYLIFTNTKSSLYKHAVPFTSYDMPTLVRSIRVVVAVLVGLHSGAVARRILHAPVNLFTHFDLPLMTPLTVLRSTLKLHLLRPTTSPPLLLPSGLETLLTRLSSLEGRLTYLKYGPTPLTTCPSTLCTSQTEFALFVFPSTALAYLTTLILCSLMTVQSVFGRGYWRRPVLVILSVCFGSEWWWCLTGTVGASAQSVDGKVTGITYTHVHLIRNTVLFLLPLILHHLSPGSTFSALPPFIATQQSHHAHSMNRGAQTTTPINANPIMALNSIINSMGSTLTALQTLKLFRVAGSRNVGIRERIADYHTAIGRNAALVRDDPLMSEYARKEGFGYQDSHSEKEDDVERKTPVEDDQSFHQENGSNVTDTDTTTPNPQIDPDLKLRDKAREVVLSIINTYVHRRQG